MDKLKSRKLWVTVLATAMVTIAEAVGIDLSQDSLIALATIVIAYVAGQAVVDRGKVNAEVQAHIPAMIDTLTNMLASVEAGKLNVTEEDRKAAEDIVAGGYA